MSAHPLLPVVFIILLAGVAVWVSPTAALIITAIAVLIFSAYAFANTPGYDGETRRRIDRANR